MNKYLLFAVMSVLSVSVSAQKLYFIYLQAETDQPFYIKMNEKIQSSTASGYLIVPKLKDSTYNITVGFPQNKWPEQSFSLTVNRKDHGYLLKNFNEKGWGLFDLQTLEIIMPAGAKAAIPQSGGTGGSGFTAILSKAADDPSLTVKPQLPKEEEKKAEVVAKENIPADTAMTSSPGHGMLIPGPMNTQVVKETEKKVESVNKQSEPVSAITIPESVKAEHKKEETPKEEVKTETIESSPVQEKTEIPAEEYKMSVVNKWSESSTTEGFGLVFLDKYGNGSIDTVRLLIPNPKQIAAVVKEEPKEEKKMLDIPVEVVKAEEKPVVMEKPLAEKPVSEKPAEEKPVAVTEAETKPAENSITETKAVIKNNCQEVAAEADFFKLRKTMAAAENDDDMIAAAKKYFKNKCFTTAQLKNLGALFLTDQGKYNFYDAAYPFAADAANYAALQAELKDEYYINRFRVMLRN